MNMKTDQTKKAGSARMAFELPILTDLDVPAGPPARAGGSIQWRSLDERDGALTGAAADDEVPSARRLAEFQALAADPAHRRDFLRLMGASMALAGVAASTGCAVQHPESVVPYVEQPEQIVPGKPMFFTTALTLDGYGIGALIESHMGRPTKVEGNPSHPASLGASDVLGQAAILNFYDPDRSQRVIHMARPGSWDRAEVMLLDIREKNKADRGKGLRILTPTITSPTLVEQIQKFLQQYPEAHWHVYTPVVRDAIRAGARQAFGEDVEPVYHLDRARVIVALDSDFLGVGPGRLHYAREFAAGREPEKTMRDFMVSDTAQVKPDPAPMNRLYSIECTPTITGASADHRIAVPARDIVAVAHAIATALGVGGSTTAVDQSLKGNLATHAKFIGAMVKDLKAAGKQGVVIAGDNQPAVVHALAHAINDALGSAGHTVEYIAPVAAGPADQVESIRELAVAINKGQVDTLLVMGGNPAYDAPHDFANLLASDKVALRVHLGLYHDETAELCHWHLPLAHELEAWGDARGFDGTAAVQQPLIAPLYRGRSMIEVMAILLGEPGRTGLEIVRDYWRRNGLGPDFEHAWRKALKDGVIASSAHQPKSVKAKAADILAAATVPASRDDLELVFRPDPGVWDGQFSNNSWLQEWPRPMTRLTWENAAYLSPAQAEKLGVEDGHVIELDFQGRKVELPAYRLPGQAESTVTVTLGYGRRRAGRVGTRIGVDVYPLRNASSPWSGSGLNVTKTDQKGQLSVTQHHFRMEDHKFSEEDRPLIRTASLTEYQKNPEYARIHEQDKEHPASLEESHSLIVPPEPQRIRQEGEQNAWGMVINLNACIGCGACVMACQSENNISVVGRDQVLASRELHWLRVDRYFEGEDENNPPVGFQPVPCMQCETAPCEVVCPVEATTHSAEGLNEMTYNRCVGTRYCSNNCPYKVRRFNFYQYADEVTPSLKLMRNPDVTVRPRGVMEKCTYCVQRINHARIRAEIEGRPVKGDEVVTACQGACPTRAIVFGNINDKEGVVAKAKESPRNYGLLADLNTRPRTTYLGKLRNPNPEIEA